MSLYFGKHNMGRKSKTKKVGKPSKYSMLLRAKHRRSKWSDYPDGVDLEWELLDDLDKLTMLGNGPAGRVVANLAAVSADVVHERRHMNNEQRARLGKDYVPMISPVKASAPGGLRYESESESESEDE